MPATLTLFLTGTLVLAQDPAPAPGQGPEFGEASPIALVIVIVLGLALVLLVRSMSKHLKRVPASFDAPADGPVEPASTPDAAAAAEKTEG